MQFKKGPPLLLFLSLNPASYHLLVSGSWFMTTILAPLKTFSKRDVTVIKKNFFFGSETVEKLLLLVKILQNIRQITDHHILFDYMQ